MMMTPILWCLPFYKIGSSGYPPDFNLRGCLRAVLLQAVPDEAVKLLLRPLLQQLEADLGEANQVISRVRSSCRLGRSRSRAASTCKAAELHAPALTACDLSDRHARCLAFINLPGWLTQLELPQQPSAQALLLCRLRRAA